MLEQPTQITLNSEKHRAPEASGSRRLLEFRDRLDTNMKDALVVQIAPQQIHTIVVGFRNEVDGETIWREETLLRLPLSQQLEPVTLLPTEDEYVFVFVLSAASVVFLVLMLRNRFPSVQRGRLRVD